MKYSLFSYFYSKKYSLLLFIINIKDVVGCFEFYDRFLFIILVSIVLDICLFVCTYILYRLCILYFYIKKNLSSLKKEELIFDIYNKEKFCIDKRTIISDRPRCRHSIKGQKNVNFLYNTNSTIVTKSLYL